MRVSRSKQGWVIKQIMGTGFLLEDTRGLGVTARHVMRDLADASVDTDAIPAALFAPPSGGWEFRRVVAHELHPSEDAALFRLEDDDYFSPYSLVADEQYASAHYALWGYPEDIQHEKMGEGGGLRPDLVYSEGHIRRRISGSLPIRTIPGESFFELSTPAGSCCSGAPVSICGPKIWSIVGIYVGELRNEANTLAVGYATRAAALVERWPALFTNDTDSSSVCPA
ncbi:hypothetical protein HNP40_002648 [Mycobacteroides chelonae]|nr:hypothetical protein [Mycobacteroides chelonae]